MNLFAKIREQLNWSDPTYRIPFILFLFFLFLFLLMLIFIMLFVPTPFQEEGQFTIFIYCFSAMESVLEEAILPAFTSYWYESTGEEVKFIVCYSGSGLITNKIHFKI